MPSRDGTRRGLRVVERKGTPVLYIRGTVRGIRVFESTGTDKAALAEERRAVREAELYREAVHGKPERKRRVTFAAAVSSYVEAEERGPATLKRLNRILKKMKPNETCDAIDQERLDRLAKEVLRPGGKPDTKLREVATPVKAILNYAARRGWCPQPHFEKTRAGSARTEWFTPAEVEVLIRASPEYFRPLIVFLFGTGARVAEALELDWADVDLEHARATLRVKARHGDNRIRIINLPPRIVSALRELRHREGVVFQHRRGSGYADHGREAGGQIKGAWNGALRRAGLKHRPPHVTRHSWATWHYARHKDLLRLKRDGDWRSVDLVERYAHLAPEGIEPSIVEFLGEVSAARSEPARRTGTR